VSNARLRVIIADDHAGLLDEIRSLLTPEFDLVALATDGKQLLAEAVRLRPDIVVTDVNMPRMNGIDASRAIVQGAHCKTIVALTMHDDPNLIRSAFSAGVGAYVLKVDAGEELIPAINAARAGKRYLSEGVRGDHINA
jgi:DNA-binding NarL/FixJ family response regulator